MSVTQQWAQYLNRTQAKVIICWHSSAKSYRQLNKNTPMFDRVANSPLCHLTFPAYARRTAVRSAHGPSALGPYLHKKGRLLVGVSAVPRIRNIRIVLHNQRYLKAVSNNVVDALSRSTINTVQIGISYPNISADQNDDVELQELRWENPALMWRNFAIDEENTTTAGKTRLPLC